MTWPQCALTCLPACLPPVSLEVVRWGRNALNLPCHACSYLAAKTPFFVSCFHLSDLRQRESNLREWCEMTLIKFGYDRSIGRNNPGAFPFQGIYQDACNVPEYGPKPGSTKPLQGASIQCNTGISAMDQCMGEQKWLRESILRSLLYVQV